VGKPREASSTYVSCGQSSEVVPVDAEQVEIAGSAWRKYAKGRHAAGLNFGDCFAYRLAKFSGQKLLAKGEDFRFTDAELVP
jgi:ribonuclease VapC